MSKFTTVSYTGGIFSQHYFRGTCQIWQHKTQPSEFHSYHI